MAAQEATDDASTGPGGDLYAHVRSVPCTRRFPTPGRVVNTPRSGLVGSAL